MSRIIAIANQKGGVGKTTTTVNLSAALASLHRRVLLIDLDPQGNATMGCGIDKHEFETGIFDVLVDGMSISEASQRSTENGCDVLPANSDLTAAEVELMGMEEREQRLHQALQDAHDNYDFILVDCPPSLNILTLNAFVAADSVLVPVQCEYYALEGLSALLETIEGVRESVNPDLAIEGLLRTMYDGRNRLGNEVSAQLIEHFGEQVFRTVVPRNIRLAEAPSHGISIMHYDSTSRGALAYLALAGEVMRNAEKKPPTASEPDSGAGQAATDDGQDDSQNPTAEDATGQRAASDPESGSTRMPEADDGDPTLALEDEQPDEAEAAFIESVKTLSSDDIAQAEHIDIGVPDAQQRIDDARILHSGVNSPATLKTDTESADG